MKEVKGLRVVPTDAPPSAPARMIGDFTPRLLDVGAHHLCPGCGEPIALRSLMEVIEELDLERRTIAVFGIGCYTAFSNNLDVEVLQALHGRAPSVATGAKRARPDTVIVTVQGDGDMVSEGLQEVLHTAARAENVTCIMLNNGVFGETGGQMTATTVLGQRTKTSLEGRNSAAHGRPILLADLVSRLDGAAYVARSAVNSAGNVAFTKKVLARALETQALGLGFSLVEILTMCPTGWFIETSDAPAYLTDNLAAVHTGGVLKDVRDESVVSERADPAMSERGSILVNGGVHGDLLAEGLRAAAPGENFAPCLPGEPVPSDAEILVTLLDDPDAIRRLLVPSVRWVHVLGAGVDGFPFDAIGERMFTCSRGAAAVAIAEWVLAVMLAFEKRLPDSWIDAPPAQWNVGSLGGLSGRTLGLVGIGAIGTEVARRALAFDVEVLAHRRHRDPAPLPGIEVVALLTDLLGRSDHLVIAAPATPETHHLIDAAALAACKRGVHLVNIARGSLVDQEALRAALDDGVVARASLDTVDPEPLPEGHWLYRHPRVRLSPHISWSAAATMHRTFELFIENLRRFRSGDALAGVVDPVAGY